MKKLIAFAAIAAAFPAAPAAAATMFTFDAGSSFVNITNNNTSCIFGSCTLSAGLATPFETFSLDVGQSRTFDFARILVSGGFGTGSADLDARLAFLTPTAGPAGTGGEANYLRLGGIFTPGALAGSLIWDTPSQQITALNGTKFTVSFGNLVGAQFANRVFAPVTITLDSVGAVPEPATWAMLILGFGAVGYSVRRRRIGYTMPATG
jgi:hypothetical protein